MRIGILGTGRMGQTFAKRWLDSGHEVVLGSRTPRAPHFPENLNVVSLAEAVEFGEIIVFAFPWHALTDILREIGKLKNKVVIDAINPLMSSGSLAVGHKTSAGEIIQNELPRAEVVKAFNHIHWQILEDPSFGSDVPDLFICGNFGAAKRKVAQLAEEIGFRPVDCGPMKQARALEPLAYLWIQMAFNYGHGTRFTFKLIEK